MKRRRANSNTSPDESLKRGKAVSKSSENEIKRRSNRVNYAENQDPDEECDSSFIEDESEKEANEKKQKDNKKQEADGSNDSETKDERKRQPKKRDKPLKKKDMDIESDKGDEIGESELRSSLLDIDNEKEMLSILQSTLGIIVKKNERVSSLVFLSFVSVCKEHPEKFNHPSVIKYLCRLLRSKNYSENKGKSPNAKEINDKDPAVKVPVLVCNLLLSILRNEMEWPIDTIKVYLDDSLNSRTWVDDKLCSDFVDNVLSMVSGNNADQSARKKLPLICKRFHGSNIKQQIDEVLSSHLESHVHSISKDKTSVGTIFVGSGSTTGNSPLRNTLLTLSALIQYPSVRALTAKKIEQWLQNPTIKTLARDLLLKCAKHCTTLEELDLEAVNSLLRLKLKSTMWQLHLDTIVQLVRQHNEYLYLALKTFISKERPNNISKGADNMKILITIFRAVKMSIPETGSKKPDASSPGSSPLPSPNRRVGSTPGGTPLATPSSSPLKIDIEKITSVANHPFFRNPAYHAGAHSTSVLAKVIQELALEIDSPSALRSIVKKLVKQVSFELIDAGAFCMGLMEDRPDLNIKPLPLTKRLEWFNSLSYLVISILMMRGGIAKGAQIQASLRASGTRSMPHVNIGWSRNTPVSLNRNAPSSSPNEDQSPRDPLPIGSIIDPNILAREEFLQLIARVQKKAIQWVFTTWPKYIENENLKTGFISPVIRRLLFMEYPLDSQATEHEKSCFNFCKNDIPIHEEVLPIMLEECLSNGFLESSELLQIMECIVARAASGQVKRESLWSGHEYFLPTFLRSGGLSGLQVNNSHIIQLLFKMIQLPMSADKPIAKSSDFWRVSTLLLILAAFNPTVLGSRLWNEYPTIRCLIQMVITNRWDVPPVDINDLKLLGSFEMNPETYKTIHLTTSVLEQIHSSIHLSDLSIVEDTLKASKINVSETELNQMLVLDPRGVARTPNPDIITHIKSLCHDLALGRRFIKSRLPDFLMEMISAGNTWQDTSKSNIGWVADVIALDPESVKYLPGSCLCDLVTWTFLSSIGNQNENLDDVSSLVAYAPKLLQRLRDQIYDTKDSNSSIYILQYFLELFASSNANMRLVSGIVLDLMLSDCLLSDFDVKSIRNWKDSLRWVDGLSKHPCRDIIRPILLKALRIISQLENSIRTLKSCIFQFHLFLDDDSSSILDDEIINIAVIYGQLLCTRPFLSNKLIEFQEINSIIIESFWRVIDRSLSPSNPNDTIEISDFGMVKMKTFLSDHGELVLTLPKYVLLGCLRILSSLQHVETKNAEILRKITHILFPSSNTNDGQTFGILNVCDEDGNNLCTSKDFYHLASTDNLILVNASVNLLPPAFLWKLLFSFGNSKSCIKSVVYRLLKFLDKNTSIEDFSQVQLNSSMLKDHILNNTNISLLYCKAAKNIIQGYMDLYGLSNWDSWKELKRWLDQKIGLIINPKETSDESMSEMDFKSSLTFHHHHNPLWLKELDNPFDVNMEIEKQSRSIKDESESLSFEEFWSHCIQLSSKDIMKTQLFFYKMINRKNVNLILMETMEHLLSTETQSNMLNDDIAFYNQLKLFIFDMIIDKYISSSFDSMDDFQDGLEKMFMLCVESSSTLWRDFIQHFFHQLNHFSCKSSLVSFGLFLLNYSHHKKTITTLKTKKNKTDCFWFSSQVLQSSTKWLKYGFDTNHKAIVSFLPRKSFYLKDRKILISTNIVRGFFHVLKLEYEMIPNRTISSLQYHVFQRIMENENILLCNPTKTLNVFSHLAQIAFCNYNSKEQLFELSVIYTLYGLAPSHFHDLLSRFYPGWEIALRKSCHMIHVEGSMQTKIHDLLKKIGIKKEAFVILHNISIKYPLLMLGNIDWFIWKLKTIKEEKNILDNDTLICRVLDIVNSLLEYIHEEKNTPLLIQTLITLVQQCAKLQFKPSPCPGFVFRFIKFLIMLCRNHEYDLKEHVGEQLVMELNENIQKLLPSDKSIEFFNVLLLKHPVAEEISSDSFSLLWDSNRLKQSHEIFNRMSNFDSSLVDTSLEDTILQTYEEIVELIQAIPYTSICLFEEFSEDFISLYNSPIISKELVVVFLRCIEQACQWQPVNSLISPAFPDFFKNMFEKIIESCKKRNSDLKDDNNLNRWIEFGFKRIEDTNSLEERNALNNFFFQMKSPMSFKWIHWLKKRAKIFTFQHKLQ